MIAIVEIKGKQYKVVQGTIIDVDFFADLQEKNLVFDQVLLIASDGKLEVGHPYLSNVRVEAEVLNPEFKDDKVLVFKYKRKVGYSKRRGHRQKYTTIRVTRIHSETLGSSKAPEKKAVATKSEPKKSAVKTEKKKVSKKPKAEAA